MDPTRLRDQSVEEAQKAFDICLQLLQRSMDRLRIPMPRHAAVSGIFICAIVLSGVDRLLVRPGHQDDVSSLVKVTKDIVKERVKGDAWVLWAKVSDCARLNNSISDYRRALMGSVPGLGQLLLRHCLEKVHKDIITCWNFKGEVLNYWNFRLHWLDLCTHR